MVSADFGEVELVFGQIGVALARDKAQLEREKPMLFKRKWKKFIKAVGIVEEMLKVRME